jgi:protease PrsW
VPDPSPPPLPSAPPPPRLPPPASTPHGWYPDPWGVAHYRWWDGHAWAANVAYYHGTGEAPSGSRRPRLPAWLSVPVLVCGLLALPFIGLAAVFEPRVLALALVPLVFIVPVLVWIDRLEPEPWASRVHAFLWGGTVAVVGAVLVNSVVLLTVGETATAVISAPLVEETMKGLGILWAVRRREVDGPVDGIVYAGWVAAGFAMIENIEYFFVASDDGVLAETFVARALLTPFAHPLFTVWIGLAIGLAVSRRWRLPWAALWGWVIAVLLHAGWNGAIAASIGFDDDRILIVAAAAFVAVFALTIVLVALVRRRERRDYVAAMPYVAHRYRVPPEEVGMFRTWGEMLSLRRRLPRADRRRFDDLHAALARLAALHARPGPVDPVDEQRLAQQLDATRAAMRPAPPR